jgi:PleD family two-component response regulator
MLPVIEEPAAAIETTQPRLQTVLLLTEHAGGSDALRQYLIQRGFEVEVLVIEENADWFAQVVASPPGAVVLDFQPAANRGWELMEVMKGNPATQDVPVVFYALSKDLDSGSILGLDHLTKPLGNAELARALDRQGLGRDAS